MKKPSIDRRVREELDRVSERIALVRENVLGFDPEVHAENLEDLLEILEEEIVEVQAAIDGHQDTYTMYMEILERGDIR